MVFEVLSPSTQGDDEGDKRRDFQTLRSLQAYVLVAQDRDGERFELPVLASPLSVADLYEGVVDADGRSLLR